MNKSLKNSILEILQSDLGKNSKNNNEEVKSTKSKAKKKVSYKNTYLS